MSMPVTHVRVPGYDDNRTICGDRLADGGDSVSWAHCESQPAHVASLRMCRVCLDFVRLNPSA